MEANACDVSHSDADVLLPPRKRLLAGLKKHNSDGNSNMPSPSNGMSKLDSSLGRFLRSHLNDPNLSPDEIIESSRLAAEAAVKVAEAARAAAEEKAAKAAKAVAAAKSALELVACVSDETARKHRSSKNNKMKKHVRVEMLYDKHEFMENCKTDEELARKLHQAMNSSPRISKHSSPSDLKVHKCKKLKTSSSSAKSTVHHKNLGHKEKLLLMNNGNGVRTELDSEASIQEEFAVRTGENKSAFDLTNKLKMDDREVQTTYAKEKIGDPLEDTSSIGRKRGRLKQKKLPLSICNFRDQANPKEELKLRSPLFSEENICKTSIGNKPLFPVVGSSSNGIIPVEKTPLWKCQTFKASSACVKQNKVMHS